MKKLLYIIIFLLVILLLVIKLHNKHGTYQPSIKKVNDNIYIINNIALNKLTNEIEFSADVVRNKGNVKFLVYLFGYKWLEQHSAIISNSKLLDLQKAIALLDWRLWDNLYNQEIYTSTNTLNMFILWDKKRVDAKSLIIPIKNNNIDKSKTLSNRIITAHLDIKHLIFLGSPYFDPVALYSSPGTVCTTCPVFNLEKESIEKEIYKITGTDSGYELNTKLMPDVGTKIIVILKKC